MTAVISTTVYSTNPSAASNNSPPTSEQSSEAHHVKPTKILAYFSTDGGRHAPRPASFPRDPVIVRSNFQRDVQNFCTRLRTEHPKACYSIWPGHDIRWYFDEYDFERQGGLFLYTVLTTLMEENGKRVVSFCQDFAENNRSTFPDWAECALTPTQLFHEQDHDEFGPDFLNYARQCLLSCYENAREERLLAVKRSEPSPKFAIIKTDKISRYCRTRRSIPSSRKQHRWCIHCQWPCYPAWHICASGTAFQCSATKFAKGQHESERKARVSTQSLAARPARHICRYVSNSSWPRRGSPRRCTCTTRLATHSPSSASDWTTLGHRTVA